jgi:Flp pilus assembly protein TadB
MVVMVVLDLLKQSHPLAATEMILQKHKKYNQHVATWNQKKHIIPNGKNTTTTKIFIIYITVQYIICTVLLRTFRLFVSLLFFFIIILLLLIYIMLIILSMCLIARV